MALMSEVCTWVQSLGWGRSRYVTLLVVIAVHLAFVAMLLMTSQTQTLSLSSDELVELLYLPPPIAPKTRPETYRPRRLGGNTVLSITPPVLDSDSPSPSSSASLGEGNGAGVDWKAEARRALQAYEIRNRQPPSRNTLSNSPAEDTWWPQGRRRAGNPFKTANGDWIVWINSNCYQVATSAANTFTLGAMLPETVCSSEAAAPRGESHDPSRRAGRPPTHEQPATAN
jgi:hypothetical protein